MPLYDHFFLILFIRYLLLAIAGDSMLREMELTQSSHYCVLTFCWKEAYTFKTKFKPWCYHENTFWLQNVKSSSSEQIGQTPKQSVLSQPSYLGKDFQLWVLSVERTSMGLQVASRGPDSRNGNTPSHTHHEPSSQQSV